MVSIARPLEYCATVGTDDELWRRAASVPRAASWHLRPTHLQSHRALTTPTPTLSLTLTHTAWISHCTCADTLPAFIISNPHLTANSQQPTAVALSRLPRKPASLCSCRSRPACLPLSALLAVLCAQSSFHRHLSPAVDHTPVHTPQRPTRAPPVAAICVQPCPPVRSLNRRHECCCTRAATAAVSLLRRPQHEQPRQRRPWGRCRGRARGRWAL